MQTNKKNAKKKILNVNAEIFSQENRNTLSENLVMMTNLARQQI